MIRGSPLGTIKGSPIKGSPPRTKRRAHKVHDILFKSSIEEIIGERWHTNPEEVDSF